MRPFVISDVGGGRSDSDRGDDLLVLAHVARVEDDGAIYIEDVDVPGVARLARSFVEVTVEDVGRPVIVRHTVDVDRVPVILGFFRAPDRSAERRPRTVRIEGETVIVSAKRAVRFECGRSEMSLDEEGRIRVRGRDILSRASGRQQIRGGTIKLN